MPICVFLCVYVFPQVCACVCIHAYVFMCACLCVCVCACVNVCVCLGVYVFAVCTCQGACSCMCICVFQTCVRNSREDAHHQPARKQERLPGRELFSLPVAHFLWLTPQLWLNLVVNISRNCSSYPQSSGSSVKEWPPESNLTSNAMRVLSTARCMAVIILA